MGLCSCIDRRREEDGARPSNRDSPTHESADRIASEAGKLGLPACAFAVADLGSF
jgi:hypothetical protein